MNDSLQTALALVAVALALGYLVWRAWMKHRRTAAGGCGSADEGCGCSAKLQVPPHVRPSQTKR